MGRGWHVTYIYTFYMHYICMIMVTVHVGDGYINFSDYPPEMEYTPVTLVRR